MRFLSSKTGQDLHVNMEGFHRASHKYVPFTYARKALCSIYFIRSFVSEVLSKHLIQALPSVYTLQYLQCLTGKINKIMKLSWTQEIFNYGFKLT